MNGLVGAKTGGLAGHLRKKEKTNGLDKKGLKTGGGEGQSKKKKTRNGLVGAKKRGRGRPT